MEIKIPSLPTEAISNAANLLFDAGPAMSHGKVATVGYVVAAFTLTRLTVSIFDGFARACFGEPEEYLGINRCGCNGEGTTNTGKEVQGERDPGSEEARMYARQRNPDYEESRLSAFSFYIVPTITALALGCKGLSAAQQGNMGRLLAIATIALGCFGLNGFSKLLGYSWRFRGHVWRDIDVRPVSFREVVYNALDSLFSRKRNNYERV